MRYILTGIFACMCITVISMIGMLNQTERAIQVAQKEGQAATRSVKGDKLINPKLQWENTPIAKNKLALSFAATVPANAVFQQLIREPVTVTLAMPRANPRPKVQFSEKEKKCLALNLYHEARGEGVGGMLAVAQVTLNRYERRFRGAQSVCGVVYQTFAPGTPRCQFSWTCDGLSDKAKDKKLWKLSQILAKAALVGTEDTALRQKVAYWQRVLKGSLHYHATYVSPNWTRQKKRIKKYGVHIFYHA